MSQGILKISLLEVDLKNAKGLTDEDSVVELRVGPHKANIQGKGKAFKSTEVSLFKTDETNLLEIYVYPKDSKEQNQLVVFGEVKLAPLLSIPNTRHLVTVHTAYQEKAILKEESSGTIQLEIFYFETLELNFDASLEIKIESASLTRDTELVDKMDPYVQIILDDSTKKTKVIQEGGKQPVWNQNFDFVLKKIDSKLVFKVKDQDVATSDLVGQIEASLLDSGILTTSNDWIKRTFDISFKNKVSGKLNFSTIFTIKHLKQ